MTTKFLWRLLVGLILIMLAGGCSSVFDTGNEGDNNAAYSGGPTFSLLVGGNELAGDSDWRLSAAYRKGMTIEQLLRASGIATFSEDGQSLLSINDVSLGSEMEWELRVDDKTVEGTGWNHTVDASARIVLTALPQAGKDPLQSVILAVNGGSDQAELTHFYVLPFTEDLTVRSLLKSSGMVQLDEANRTVLTVKDYVPLMKEMWKLKVNGKQLLENGMDMLLRPQDELEISLVLR